METNTVDITIVGAGVIGLAVAHYVTSLAADLVVIEKEPGPGQGISSRNSEVIHTGIYYPPNFLKTTLCVQGSTLLYEFCDKYHIPCKRIGKVVVGTNKKEAKEIEGLLERGKQNGVRDLYLIERQELKKIEPHIKGTLALHCPNAGIIDSHRLTKTLEALCLDEGSHIIYNTMLTGLEKTPKGFLCEIKTPDDSMHTFMSGIVINCAGLSSDQIAKTAGIDIEDAGYKIYPCKGEYFRVRGGKQLLVNSLVYPSPLARLTGLGIHTTKDLAGTLKLGPNNLYTDKIEYNIDPLHAKDFLLSINPILPFIEEEDIVPDMAGIRPKIQGPHDPLKDFVITLETKAGLEGMINLIGIESPGLTACLAIGQMVKALIKDSGLLM